MSQPFGWQSSLGDILDTGVAVRRAIPFDEQARRQDVERRVAAAGKFPLWTPFLAIPALLLPAGPVWAVLVLAGSALLFHLAKQRREDVQARLAAETERLKQKHDQEAARFAATLRAADAGDPAAVQSLLARWLERRPQTLHAFESTVTKHGDAWHVRGTAIPRDEIPAGVPRIGRGGRTVFDKRKAAEIDEDLTELNAAAVLSILFGLFSGPRSQRIIVRVTMATPTTGDTIPWVTLDTAIDHDRLLSALDHLTVPSEGLRALGGDVGRCRSQRFTAAREPGAGTAANAASAERPAPPTAPVTPARTGAGEPPRPANPAISRDVYGQRAAALDFSSPAVSVTVSLGGVVARSHIPPALSHLRTGTSVAGDAVPTQRNVQGPFATVARRFVDYEGDPSARFVAFQAYWSQYSHMAPGQLKFYFKWRNAVRKGETPRTDLSYIFVHVYELLHIIGAKDATDAGAQLERLWTSYRDTFPALDRYMTSWTADLYATEIGSAEALAFVQRAGAMGARLGSEELLLIADQFWARGDYVGMPQHAVGVLAGDPRLGDNKFYREHNGAEEGAGWIDRAYREALVVADRVFEQSEGKRPRDAEIERFGQQEIVREAFQGAVYEWKRKPAHLGKVPRIADGGLAIPLYRNAVRYAENLLRKERGFTAKLRGVEVSPDLARALEAHFGGFVRATKPKPRVTIDLAKAKDLARESADVRARLLEGIEDHHEEPASSSRPPTAPSSAPTPPSLAPDAASAVPATSAHVPPGLLTDLVAVQAALATLTPASRAVLEALAATGWEAPERAPVLAAAAQGALVGPLVDEINEHAVDAIGDVLIVHEGDLLVVQEDFRDEVYWVLRGSLEGFGAAPTTAPVAASGPPAMPQSPAASPELAPTVGAETDGFGPLELRVLSILTGNTGVGPALADLAADHLTTPLLLLDRTNELALTSSYGDLVVDVDRTPPILMPDAEEYVAALVARVQPLLATAAEFEIDESDVADSSPASV